jgi:hypothetical protein
VSAAADRPQRGGSMSKPWRIVLLVLLLALVLNVTITYLTMY